MKSAVAALAVSGLMLAAAPAGAGEEPIVIADRDVRIHRHVDLESLDQDGDGKVSRDEFLGRSREKFDALDADGDGFIDEQEREAGSRMDFDQWKEFEEQRWESLLERFDANQDAMLELDEVMAKVEQRVAEAMERLEERGIRWGHDFEMPDPPRVVLPHGPGVFMFESLAGRLFEAADADADGKVTAGEFAAARDRLFEKLDQDGDGVLTRNEMRALGFPGRFAFHHFHSEDEEDEQ